jgi:hypothetical protein
LPYRLANPQYFLFSCVILSNFSSFGKRFYIPLKNFFQKSPKNRLSSYFSLFLSPLYSLSEVIMFLSAFCNKLLYLDGECRGVCVGVAVSKKNYSIKYLLCAHERATRPDFALPFSALRSIGIHGLTLSRVRPAIPKNVFKLFPSRPVYSAEGAYLGALQDVEFENEVATKLLTTENLHFSFACVNGVCDAVILRKSPVYPLGQRIHTSLFSENSSLVTKSVLRRAIEKRALIKLTLSLSPFVTPNTSPTASTPPQGRR